ncbi:MAG TPA: hypothetical protein VHB27_23855, partial [Rhodopila sp.]|nr:hypothetical protein [Rhodopila sp.]
MKSLFVAVPVAVGLLAAPAAQAQWHGGPGGPHGGYRGPPPRGQWHGGGDWHHHDHDGGNGGAIAGAILGLGAA